MLPGAGQQAAMPALAGTYSEGLISADYVASGSSSQHPSQLLFWNMAQGADAGRWWLCRAVQIY